MFADNQDDAAPSDPTVLVAAMEGVKQVLAEAKSLAPTLVESQNMCLHVLERLEAIIARVETSQPQTSPQAISRLSAIARADLDFLKKFANKKAAFRLVRNRKVVSQNLAFHDDIDNLLRGLEFPEDDWRQRWEGYRDGQQAAFEAMSRNRVALIGDLRDAQAQTEALGLLLFEFHQVNSKYTQKELKVLNNAFGIVSQFSKNKAPTIGTWFLPPYEFDCDPTPFAWGAFGTVHHGKHCGSDVVIKRAKIASEADRAAFVREANTWFNANRIPNVVRLFGAYQIGPDPYFVCEYAANGTLSDYLFKEEHRHLTWKLLHEAALGLRGLHRLKIVHNDLKCNNILVATDGIAKLTDFGLSSQVSAQQSQSVSKPVGAYSWKAPELLAGTSAPTFESDIFAFAMCIYEAVSHTRPWSGAMDVVIQRNVKKGILPKRPDVFTNDQWTLVESMCTLSPADRLSMDKVVDQLERFHADEFNATFPPPTFGDSLQNNQTADEPFPDQSIIEAASTTAPQGDLPTPPASSSQGHSVTAASVMSSQKTMEGGKEVAQYQVCLALENGTQVNVWKRYSNFRLVHRHFSLNFQTQMASCPRFPRRKPFWSTLSNSTIEQRQEGLDEFLKAVIASELPLRIVAGEHGAVYNPDVICEVAL